MLTKQKNIIVKLIHPLQVAILRMENNDTIILAHNTYHVYKLQENTVKLKFYNEHTTQTFFTSVTNTK